MHSGSGSAPFRVFSELRPALLRLLLLPAAAGAVLLQLPFQLAISLDIRA